MKALVLAAGYGTRLQPVIGDTPKPLVELGGASILDRLLAQLAPLVDDMHVVCNARYFDAFRDWQARSRSRVFLHNDGSTSADNRLGAIGDIAYGINEAALDDALLVCAADNVFHFGLDEFVRGWDRTSVRLAIRHNPDEADQRRRGVVTLNADLQVTGFVEKPDRPASEWAAMPVYLLPREMLSEIHRYLAEGNNPDAPGHFIAWCVERHPLTAWRVPGAVLDIGTPETLQAAREILESKD